MVQLWKRLANFHHWAGRASSRLPSCLVRTGKTGEKGGRPVASREGSSLPPPGYRGKGVSFRSSMKASRVPKGLSSPHHCPARKAKNGTNAVEASGTRLMQGRPIHEAN